MRVRTLFLASCMATRAVGTGHLVDDCGCPFRSCERALPSCVATIISSGRKDRFATTIAGTFEPLFHCRSLGYWLPSVADTFVCGLPRRNLLRTRLFQKPRCLQSMDDTAKIAATIWGKGIPGWPSTKETTPLLCGMIPCPGGQSPLSMRRPVYYWRSGSQWGEFFCNLHGCIVDVCTSVALRIA